MIESLQIGDEIHDVRFGDNDLAGRRIARRQVDHAVARFLLTATPARDLEVTSTNLEDAVVALTSDALEGAPA